MVLLGTYSHCLLFLPFMIFKIICNLFYKTILLTKPFIFFLDSNIFSAYNIYYIFSFIAMEEKKSFWHIRVTSDWLSELTYSWSHSQVETTCGLACPDWPMSEGTRQKKITTTAADRGIGVIQNKAISIFQLV